MKRREFIAGLGGAVAWPLAARAQQPALPVVGYLDGGSFDTSRETAAGVLRGLSEAEYFENRNLAVEYRWAEDHYERLPALVNDLVRRRVAVIIASTTPAALAAKAATQSIPIVFFIGTDPIDLGLVPSFSRPGSNLTGISVLNRATAAKRLELLSQLVPEGRPIAYLVNPANPFFAEPETRDLENAARTLRVRLLIMNATDPSEFERAFATLVHERAGGLIVGSDTLFYNQPAQIIALAARHQIPVIYYRHEAALAGGLVSYGTDLPDAWRQAGLYAGRILKGEKPASLPVQQSTKFKLAINLKTAKPFGLKRSALLFRRPCSRSPTR
jgi:putative tryptophan/tyrosine transport system substrate-binding protein